MHDQYKYTYFWRAGGPPPALSFYIFHHLTKLIIYFRKYHNGLPFWHSAEVYIVVFLSLPLPPLSPAQDRNSQKGNTVNVPTSIVLSY
jgi:hypothetical protein